MRYSTWCASLFGIALLFVMSAGSAQAQATRTWISGVGDDANPCSRTAPCKTFAGAISKTAAGGEIDCLDPGGFGAVTIVKAMTLDCGPNADGILYVVTRSVPCWSYDNSLPRGRRRCLRDAAGSRNPQQSMGDIAGRGACGIQSAVCRSLAHDDARHTGRIVHDVGTHRGGTCPERRVGIEQCIRWGHDGIRGLIEI
jgi:hypothetical protein